MTSRSFPSQNRMRLFAARLGLCALLIQALFPSLLAGFLSSKTANFWDTVVLCTAEGAKTVALSGLEGADHNAPGQKAPHAPYCPACPGYFQANAAITPAMLVGAKPSFGEAERLLPSDDRGPDGHRFVPQSARAPPFLA